MNINSNKIRGVNMIRKRWLVDKKYKDLSIEILQDNLSALRAKAGLNQEEIANILGISRQTYYAIETQKKKMSWGTFMSLVFFYHEINSTSRMLYELKVYPIDLFKRFNEE